MKKTFAAPLSIIFAVLLTLANLCWGANYDITLVWFALITAAIACTSCFAAAPVRPTYHMLWLALAGLITFLVVQYFSLLPPRVDQSPHSTAALLEQTQHSMNQSLWLAESGKFLWFFLCLMIGYVIASSQLSARLFLRVFFYLGTITVAFTFMASKRAISLSSEKFSHGFVSENNAATYLGLLLLLCFAELLRYVSRLPTHPLLFLKKTLLGNDGWKNLLWPAILLLAALLLLSGLFATASRGGIVASFIGIASLVGLHLFRSFSSKVSTGKRYVFSGIIVCLLIAVSAIAFMQYGFKLDSILARDGFHDRFRPALYHSSAIIGADHLPLGAGLGNFSSIFPSYRPASLEPEGIYEYAHNSFLHYFVEMGLIGLLAEFGFVMASFFALLHRYRHNAGSGIDASLGLSLLAFICCHAMVDFPLQIPSLLCSAAVLILCCTHKTQVKLGSYSRR